VDSGKSLPRAVAATVTRDCTTSYQGLPLVHFSAHPEPFSVSEIVHDRAYTTESAHVKSKSGLRVDVPASNGPGAVSPLGAGSVWSRRRAGEARGSGTRAADATGAESAAASASAARRGASRAGLEERAISAGSTVSALRARCHEGVWSAREVASTLSTRTCRLDYVKLMLINWIMRLDQLDQLKATGHGQLSMDEPQTLNPKFRAPTQHNHDPETCHSFCCDAVARAGISCLTSTPGVHMEERAETLAQLRDRLAMAATHGPVWVDCHIKVEDSTSGEDTDVEGNGEGEEGPGGGAVGEEGTSGEVDQALLAGAAHVLGDDGGGGGAPRRSNPADRADQAKRKRCEVSDAPAPKRQSGGAHAGKSGYHGKRGFVDVPVQFKWARLSCKIIASIPQKEKDAQQQVNKQRRAAAEHQRREKVEQRHAAAAVAAAAAAAADARQMDREARRVVTDQQKAAADHRRSEKVEQRRAACVVRQAAADARVWR